VGLAISQVCLDYSTLYLVDLDDLDKLCGWMGLAVSQALEELAGHLTVWLQLFTSHNIF
jgi:hypothetical protein